MSSFHGAPNHIGSRSSARGSTRSIAGSTKLAGALPLRASSEGNRRPFGTQRGFSRRSGSKNSRLGQPKKLKIQGFKRKPQLPENFEDESWGKLRNAIHAVYSKRPIEFSREELYRTTEDLCLHKMGPRLYSRVQIEFEAHSVRTVSKLCAYLDGGTGEQTASAACAPSVAYLQRLSETWDDFCQETFAVRSIFLYLDRTYVLQSGGSSATGGSGCSVCKCSGCS